ncbi:MAG: hypothetical protein ACLPKB_13130 [Xanthobacteraceae bacterium]
MRQLEAGIHARQRDPHIDGGLHVSSTHHLAEAAHGSGSFNRFPALIENFSTMNEKISPRSPIHAWIS